MSHVDPIHESPQLTVGSIVPLDIGKPTNIDALGREFVTKDSGAREEWSTGSRRDLATGKGRFDLIPPIGERRLAELYERGAAKYGNRNWEKGQPLMRYVDSAKRHLNNLIAGEPDEDHATAVVFNMFGFLFTLDRIEAGLLPDELDDRPDPEPRYRR